MVPQYSYPLMDTRLLGYLCTLATLFHWGSIYEAYGSLLNSKDPFMLKRFYNDKKELFWHIGYYSFIFYIILQHFVVVIKLLFIKPLILHFNHADFWRRKTEMALFV